MGGAVRRGLGPLLAVGCLLAAVGCSSSPEPAEGSAPGSVVPSPTARPGVLLALGDSVPFGFRSGEDAATYRDPTAFAGYPELLAEDLGLEVVNAACPGETTESFIDATAQSNGCQDTLSSDTGFRTTFPLHVDYDPADQAQLDFALGTLQRDDDVELVTLQVGANDAFLCQQTTADRCQAEGHRLLADAVAAVVPG